MPFLTRIVSPSSDSSIPLRMEVTRLVLLTSMILARETEEQRINNMTQRIFNYKVLIRLVQSVTMPPVANALASAACFVEKEAALLFIGLFNCGLTTKNADFTSRNSLSFS